MKLKKNNLILKTKLPLVAFLLSATWITPSVLAQTEVLTGDTRLACEAILCLSSGLKPSECTSSLKRYFGITHKRPDKMIKNRINFLNMCPAAHEPDMPSLVQAIGRGAGQCDAAHLNQYNTQIRERQECRYVNADAGSVCRTIKYTVIHNKNPEYCAVYENHEYTDLVTPKYVGSPEANGRWVEGKNYEKEQKKYLQEQERSNSYDGFSFR